MHLMHGPQAWLPRCRALHRVDLCQGLRWCCSLVVVSQEWIATPEGPISEESTMCDTTSSSLCDFHTDSVVGPEIYETQSVDAAFCVSRSSPISTHQCSKTTTHRDRTVARAPHMCFQPSLHQTSQESLRASCHPRTRLQRGAAIPFLAGSPRGSTDTFSASSWPHRRALSASDQPQLAGSITNTTVTTQRSAGGHGSMIS
jgi:hypothetical protein